MTASAIQQPAPRRSAPPPVTWSVWPLVEPGGAIAELVAPVSLAVLAGAVTTGRIGWGLLLGLVTALAMWRFFVPTYYELSVHGLREDLLRATRRLPWKSIESYQLTARGAWLTLSSPNAFHRGRIYLPIRERRDEVLASLAWYLQTSRQTDSRFGFELNV